MGRIRPLLVVLAGTMLLAGVAWLIARVFGMDKYLTFLGCMVAAYVALSTWVAARRRGLAARLRELPVEEQAALATLDPEIRFALAPSRHGLSARAATWIGLILINGPIIPIMVAPLFLREVIVGGAPSVWTGGGLVLAGFILAWSWWSVGVTIWRQWAARRGVEPDELQWRGEKASLLWPRGHWLERTELEQIMAALANTRAGRRPPSP